MFVGWLILTLTGCGNRGPVERGTERQLPAAAADARGAKMARRAAQGGEQAADGATLVTLTSTGDERTAYVHIPAGVEANAPVVINMHGSKKRAEGSGGVMSSNWAKHFDKGIIFAFPNATHAATATDGRPGSTKTWYGGEDTGPDRLKDVQFLKDLVDLIDSRASVDRSQIYLSGFSAGGGFTWFASCQAPDDFAGFGVVGMMPAKGVVEACPDPVDKPIVYLHGELDPKVPIEGMEHTPSRTELKAWMLGGHGCETSPRSTPRVQGSGGRANGEVFACGDALDSVELWRVTGAGHCWPTDNKCSGVDTSDLFLDYWRRTAGLTR